MTPSEAAANSVAAAESVTAVLSMLHEPAGRNSATRTFRNKPVLRWTLDRLARCQRLTSIAVICWEDQLNDVVPMDADARIGVLVKGPRVALPEVEAVAAARRWADGWRGGLLSTCDFDLGFYAPYVQEVAAQFKSDNVVIVDASAALVDPSLIDELIAHAQRHPSIELCVTPVAAGLGGAFMRRALLARLAAARGHAGRLLHYLPDQVSREVLATDACLAVPASIARTTRRFTIDSDRQVQHVTEAMHSLNGQLMGTPAEQLVQCSHARSQISAFPRELTIELGTRRATKAIFRASTHHPIDRPDMTAERLQPLLAELAACDDIRLTLAGVGDPMLCPAVFEIVERARAHGVRAIHIETDLLDVSEESIASLARSGVDIISVHLPATSPETYAAIMGVNECAAALENVRRLVTERHSTGGRLPIIAPTFVKCRQNLGEMEAWYDQWLRAVGSAVILGATDFAGLIPDPAVADMSPPRRRPCSRLASRVMLLSDGRYVSCEQDMLGQQPMGLLGEQSLKEIWQKNFDALRGLHVEQNLASLKTCGGCREWHRP